MRLIFDKGRFVVHCPSITEFLDASAAGFVTDDPIPPYVFYTEDPRVAVRLRHLADRVTTRRIEDAFITETPWTGRLPHPKTLKPKQYQKIAAWFALRRRPSSYLAMDAGTGKTAVAGMVHNALAVPSVFISPPALVLTAEAELQKWCPTSLVSEKDEVLGAHPIWILSDTTIHKPETRDGIASFLKISRETGKEPTLFIDEAHRFVNIEARRTKALLQGLVPSFRRTVYLSGTPMPNRPIELYPILKASAWSTIDFMSELEYGRRYCSGRMTERGWDLSGSSNMPELAGRIHGTFMHRVRTEDVLPELPPVTEEVVFIGGNLPPALAKLEREVFDRYSPEDLVGRAFAEASGRGSINDVPLSTYRKELGLIKVPFAIKFLTELLEESAQAFLVFAHHREVLELLNKALDRFNPVTITGTTRMDHRHHLVREFQNDASRRLVLANIKAAGVGYTMTRASRVVLPEYSWVPADNEQAIKRAHRIGQRSHVFAQYLAFRNSGDRRVLEVVLRKRQVISHI